jgi:serine/threonine protein kinase
MYTWLRIKMKKKLCVLKTFENQGVYDENFYRFLNEEKYSSRVSHQQIVQAQRIQVGHFGLVLKQKYVSGGSLGDVLEDNGVFSEAFSIEIAVQLLMLLQKIHESGIIHNDIKPGNIIIDNSNRVHLIDFGIAYNINKYNEAIVTGIAAGSQGYMAPEIVRMNMPSRASDFFSTGVVFSQMLCGKILSSFDEVLKEKSIHKKFHPFLHKCLSHAVEFRFSSADDALEELKKINSEKRQYITLDIEGTLVTNYQSRYPRPGLESFLNFCADNYHRIFIYTLLDSDRAREVFDSLLARGLAIEAFSEKYEYIYWDRGKHGSVKDLRRCLVPLEENMIVDDMDIMVPEDQHHRHIHINDYNEPVGHDGGLLIARQRLEREI